MSTAKRIHRVMSERGDRNLEFARDGFRLTLNPIESRFTEIGFILWREDEATGALDPVAVGRAVDNQLVLDGEPNEAGFMGVAGTIEALLDGELIASLGGGGNEQAIPTGT